VFRTCCISAIVLYTLSITPMHWLALTPKFWKHPNPAWVLFGKPGWGRMGKRIWFLKAVAWEKHKMRVRRIATHRRLMLADGDSNQAIAKLRGRVGYCNA